jgi:membrane associated rhomboid family serine protease
MGRIVGAVIYGVIGAIVLGAAFVAGSLALPKITGDPSAAAATAVFGLMGVVIGFLLGAFMRLRRPG